MQICIHKYREVFLQILVHEELLFNVCVYTYIHTYIHVHYGTLQYITVHDPSIRPSVHPSLRPSVPPSIRPSIHPSIPPWKSLWLLCRSLDSFLEVGMRIIPKNPLPGDDFERALCRFRSLEAALERALAYNITQRVHKHSYYGLRVPKP